MSYLKLLQSYKEKLSIQLQQKNFLKERYAVQGYISNKTIDGRKYKYLQYHTKDGELVSIYLNDTVSDLYETAVKRRQKIEHRINQIKNDLDLFSGVPLEKEVGSDILKGNIRNFRLLNNAIGISEEFHILFRLIPKTNPGEYEITATYKKRQYSAPMIYVNERYISNIGNYVKAAGIIIDETIRKDIKIIPKINTLYGTTLYGIKYTAQNLKNVFMVKFKYNKETIKIEYKPDKDPSYMLKHIYKTEISQMIDDYCNRRMTEDAIRRIYG